MGILLEKHRHTYQDAAARNIPAQQATVELKKKIQGVFGFLVTSKIRVTSNVQILIKSIKYRLITKPIKQMDAKLRDDFLSLINLSLAHVYCNTTSSNHGLIRLKRFVSQISRKLCNQFRNQSIFNTPCMCLNIRCDINFRSVCRNQTPPQLGNGAALQALGAAAGEGVWLQELNFSLCHIGCFNTH